MARPACPPESDLFIPVPDGDAWNAHTIHTHYFGFSVPEAGIGAYVYVRYQPAFPLSQGGVCIFQGFDNIHGLDVEYLDYEMTMPWPECSGTTIVTRNGLRIEFIEPGKTVRLTYRSADGATSFDLLQSAVTPLVGRDHGLPEESTHVDRLLTAGGSEQFMHCTGDLVLNGQNYDVDCYPIRDRSWCQVRTERTQVSPPLGWTPMYFGPDLAFTQGGFEALDTHPAWEGVIEIEADRPAHQHGWVYTDGETLGLVRVRRNVLKYDPVMHVALAQEIEAEDEKGGVHRFSGEAVALGPLPVFPNLLAFDTVYRWQDARGRVTFCTYMEMWWQSYQRAMKPRRRA